MPLMMPGCFSKFLPNQEKTAGAEPILAVRVGPIGEVQGE